jgi:hypothetical protein
MSIAKDAETENIGSDLLWGAEAISREIDLPLKKTYYRLERGEIPARRVGNIYVGSRRKLRAHFAGE